MTVMRQCSDWRLLQSLRKLLQHFDYASCGLYGHGDGIVIMRAAHSKGPDKTVLEHLNILLGMTDDVPVLSYSDSRRGISKRILVENEQVTGVCLIGETLAGEWLKEVMTQGKMTDELRRWALAPLDTPPVGHGNRGKIICNCLNVAENEIIEVINLGGNLPALQAKLKCGTECGSCVPELKRLVQTYNKNTD